MLLLTAGSKERSRRAAEPQESHACSCGEDYRTGEEEYPTPCVCCADETRRDDPATQGWDIGVHQCVHPPSMCSLRGANLCHLGVPASIPIPNDLVKFGIISRSLRTKVWLACLRLRVAFCFGSGKKNQLRMGC